MKEDPRRRNELCESSSIGTYMIDYADKLKAVRLTVDQDALDKARCLIEGITAVGKHIFSIGNGGSATIADHMCCDWVKGAHYEAHPAVDTVSFGSAIIYS